MSGVLVDTRNLTIKILLVATKKQRKIIAFVFSFNEILGATSIWQKLAVSI